MKKWIFSPIVIQMPFSSRLLQQEPPRPSCIEDKEPSMTWNEI
jgi:hypothetical protein